MLFSGYFPKISFVWLQSAVIQWWGWGVGGGGPERLARGQKITLIMKNDRKGYKFKFEKLKKQRFSDSSSNISEG